MAGFKFKFQAMLNIKEQTEEILKNQLGVAIQKLEREKGVLKDLKGEKKRCISELGSETSKGVTIEKLRGYNVYISSLKQKIINQSERVKEQQQVVDKYREELLKITKERKMLGKLKEKQKEEYFKEQIKKEQKIVDETISYKQSLKNE